jgi:homocysteine S-methyltransferase
MKKNPQIIGFGLNCMSPQSALAALPNLKQQLNGESSAALIVYPNSGQVYDAEKKEWSQLDQPKTDWSHFAKSANELGATVIGGCCQTTFEDVRAISSMLSCKPQQS